MIGHIIPLGQRIANDAARTEAAQESAEDHQRRACIQASQAKEAAKAIRPNGRPARRIYRTHQGFRRSRRHLFLQRWAAIVRHRIYRVLDVHVSQWELESNIRVSLAPESQGRSLQNAVQDTI
jgi:hypothetical protein